MIKSAILIAILITAYPSHARGETYDVVKDMPTGCIDPEYYYDLEYYGEYKVVAYGAGGIEYRGDVDTTELIQVDNGQQYVAYFRAEDVCIVEFNK